MHEHVRMRDVRLYLRDVLREYGALMTYTPQPLPGAICYSGGSLCSSARDAVITVVHVQQYQVRLNHIG